MAAKYKLKSPDGVVHETSDPAYRNRLAGLGYEELTDSLKTTPDVSAQKPASTGEVKK